MEKDKQIELRENMIAEKQRKIETMSRDFGEMLKETLDKVGEKIETASKSKLTEY
jgi:flagellar hook-basal body complex protein FliE